MVIPSVECTVEATATDNCDKEIVEVRILQKQPLQCVRTIKQNSQVIGMVVKNKDNLLVVDRYK